MKHFLKVLVGISLVVVAASAHAQITLESFGTWALGGALPMSAFTDTESVLYPPSSTGPFGQLTSMSTDFAIFAPIGIATYTGPGGNVLDLALEVTDFETSADGLTDSFDGVWSYLGGTGTYDPSLISSGDGTFAVSQWNTPGGFSGTVLVGTLYAVPEPGTYAALGLGVLGLCIRRRRRS